MIVWVLVLCLWYYPVADLGEGPRGGRLPPPPSFLDESRGLLVEFVWGYFILELIGIDAFVAISDNCIQHFV